MKTLRLLALPLAVLGLAGCTEDAVIAFHGEGAGVDTLSFLCERGAKPSISVSYKGDFGKTFNVRALTPINKDAAFNRTFTLPGPEMRVETFELDAIEGRWELRVERHDPFKGNIEVVPTC